MSIRVVNDRWHKPTDNDTYIGKGSILENPFSHEPMVDLHFTVDTRNESIIEYRKYLNTQLALGNEVIMNEIKRLKELYDTGVSINLVCSCAPEICHGDLIKEIIKYGFFNSDEY